MRCFISCDADPDDIDFDCLETLVNHYQSYAATPRPENLLLLHYSNMLADARGAIARIAIHMGLDPDPVLIEAVHEASSFKTMKSQADRSAPFSEQGYWHDPQAFFDSAGTPKWAGKLREGTVSLYQDKIAQLLSPTEIAWLEGGEAT